jgi:hypothetical protein
MKTISISPSTRQVSLAAWASGMALGLIGASALAAPPSPCFIDFEGLPAGTVITELSVGAGISGCSGNGKKVLVESQNALFNPAAIVFDSDCPVVPFPFSDCDSLDVDLGTPNEDFGGPGVGAGGEAGSPYENDEALHNVAVLANDMVDINMDDLVDDPDDADIPGSYTFDFASEWNNKGVTINSVTLLDIEFEEGESPATIELIVPGSPTAMFAQVDTGNNGVGTVNFVGLSGVTEMKVNVLGSSALAAVTFDEPKAPRACWATYGGFNNAFIGPEGQKVASFGGNVGPPPSGHLNIVRHADGSHLSVPDVDVVSCERVEALCPNSGSKSPGQPGGNKGFDVNVLNFAGTGKLVDSSGYSTTVNVTGQLVDCGEPANKKTLDPDRFSISFDGSGVYVEGPLDGGNVQLHPPNGSITVDEG